MAVDPNGDFSPILNAILLSKYSTWQFLTMLLFGKGNNRCEIQHTLYYQKPAALVVFYKFSVKSLQGYV